MPAEVETLAYTAERGVPWHGLGTPVDGLMTAEEALAASGLDWEVRPEPIMTVAGEPIPMKRAIVRQSDRRVLGVVGNQYVPVQNREAFSFADAIVADSDSNKYETAGALDDGRTIFLSMDLGAVEPIRVAGDPTDFETYLVLSNAHDGTKALRATITPVRVVCMNTLNLAFRGSTGVFSVRHSGDIESKMKAAQQALSITVDYLRRFEQVAEELLAKQVSDKRALAIYRDAFEMAPTTEEKGEESEWYVQHAAQRVFETYQTSETVDPIRGTGWGVLNAAAEFVDHDRVYGKGTKRSPGDVKMDSLLWGEGHDVLNRLVPLISATVGADMSLTVRKDAARKSNRVAVAMPR